MIPISQPVPSMWQQKILELRDKLPRTRMSSCSSSVIRHTHSNEDELASDHYTICERELAPKEDAKIICSQGTNFQRQYSPTLNPSPLQDDKQHQTPTNDSKDLIVEISCSYRHFRDSTPCAWVVVSVLAKDILKLPVSYFQVLVYVILQLSRCAKANLIIHDSISLKKEPVLFLWDLANNLLLI